MTTSIVSHSTKQQLFLDALLSEEAMGDLRAAMRIATETLLAMYAPKAAYALTSILDNPDTFNARHIISASKEILDRTGLGAKSQMELDVNAPSTIFILPPKQTE